MKADIKVIERKVTSVQKISKITNAMKIIATMQFQTAFKQIQNNNDFTLLFEETFASLQCLLDYYKDSTKPKQTVSKPSKLWIIFASDLGLCGAYNNLLLQKCKQVYQPGDQLIVVGKKAVNHFRFMKVPINQHYDVTNFVNQHLSTLIDWLITNRRLFSVITIIYMHFVSSSQQNVVSKQLLPFPLQATVNPRTIIADFLVEPNPHLIYQTTLPLYLHSWLLICYWHAKTSEEKSRQIAMENATDNVEEMVNDLKLQYNQLRQEKITKEIILVSQDS